jgi:hypothetical protein
MYGWPYLRCGFTRSIRHRSLVIGLRCTTFTAMDSHATCCRLFGTTVPFSHNLLCVALNTCLFGIQRFGKVCDIRHLLPFCDHHRIRKHSGYQHIQWEWTVDSFGKNTHKDDAIFILSQRNSQSVSTDQKWGKKQLRMSTGYISPETVTSDVFYNRSVIFLDVIREVMSSKER